MPTAVCNPPTVVANRKPAPFVVGPTNKAPFRPTTKLPQQLIDTARAEPSNNFDAQKHVYFQPPPRRYTMKEWGYEGQGISPIAASDPFPLLTKDAVKQVRRELFSHDILNNYQFASTFTKCQIRGYPKETAPFIHSLWKSPEVLDAVSSVAGIELVPLESEIGHTNVFIGGEDKETANDNVGFSWHYDSFPFVCVSMLSDCTDMQGGETAVYTGTGEVLKVRGPTMGTAVMLQGRYVKHAALKAFGSERISFITAFRPKDPLVKDEIVLTGSRPISDQSMLLYQYCTYRADLVVARFQDHAEKLRKAQAAGVRFDVNSVKEFVQEQMELMTGTLKEMIPIYDIVES